MTTDIHQFGIGSLVNYVRFHPKDGILQGKGFVKAYGLDPENRVIALIQDKKRKDPNTGKPMVFNVPARGVNPSPQFVTDITELAARVDMLTGEANAAIAKLTKEANDQLKVMNDEVLGAPLNLPEGVAEDEPKAEAQE